MLQALRGRRAVGRLGLRRPHRRRRPRSGAAHAGRPGHLPGRRISSIELLWASPREILNVVQADEIGVDIITVTEAIRTKLHLLGKDLDEFSRETVLMFKRDGEAAGYRYDRLRTPLTSTRRHADPASSWIADAVERLGHGSGGGPRRRRPAVHPGRRRLGRPRQPRRQRLPQALRLRGLSPRPTTSRS